MSQPADASSLVLVASPARHVRVLAFNRPERRNALSQALIDQFVTELAKANEDNGVKVIIIAGTEAYFSAGADLSEIAALDAMQAADRMYLLDLCRGMQQTEKPIIAAVEGFALGGGFEVALMCDFILASSTSVFALPEVKIGVIPGAGGTQRLTNAIGKFRAMKMILFGSQITAREAESWGLVAELSEPGEVLANAVKMASLLAEQSSTAVASAKRAICAQVDRTILGDVERKLYYSTFSSKDKVEGINAFLQKRSPVWSGEPVSSLTVSGTMDKLWNDEDDGCK